LHPISRRTLLGGLAVTAALFPASLKAAPLRPRFLNLHNIRTGEKFRGEFYDRGCYLPDACRELNWLLRDHHCDVMTEIDPGVLDLLWSLRDRIARTTERDVIVNVHSAYRTPQTNHQLEPKGAASNSWHMSGRAVDLSVQGVSIRPMAKQARTVQTGGLGIYWRSRFVHLDTGPKRIWQQRA
jgi:uncharacterized protein YcbK (DUF882 family)